MTFLQQKNLLNVELEGIEHIFKAGQKVVTWSPAALTHFSKSTKTVVSHVKVMSSKLIKLTHRLNDFLSSIATTNLLDAKGALLLKIHAQIPPFSVSDLLFRCCHMNTF